MIKCVSLFSQVLSILNRHHFQERVREHQGDYASKGFGCWDQMVSMLFCQLAQARSLREIQGGLQSCEGKLKHLGLGQAPGRSTLSYANAHRPWQIYQKTFYDLLEQVRQAAPSKKFRFKNKLLSLDATIIELSLGLYDWAKYRRTKGALKLHLLLDHDGYLPVFADLTEGKAHELGVARNLRLPEGSIVAMDRAYIDYEMFETWSQQGVFFVTRLKKNTDWCFEPGQDHEGPHRHPVLADDRIVLNAFNTADGRPCRRALRRVVIWSEEKQQEIELVTNIHHLAASTIGAIYKERWQIELFFKAIKGQLRIKTFVGTSPNAVRIQIWTALIAMLLLKYLQFKSRVDWSLSNMVALLRWNLFTYRDLWQWINRPFQTPPGPLEPQLQLPLLDSTRST